MLCCVTSALDKRVVCLSFKKEWHSSETLHKAQKKKKKKKKKERKKKGGIE
jgi:hypothetical protein